MKKIVSVIVMLCILAGYYTSAYAVVAQYTTGKLTYSVDIEDYKKIKNGQVVSYPEYEDKWIDFAENGEVLYEAFLPINAESVTIYGFLYEDTNLKIMVNGKEYVKEALATDVGVEPFNYIGEKISITFDKVALIVDLDIKIKTSKPYRLKQIIFNREKRPSRIDNDSTGEPLTAFTDYEDALLTSVVIGYKSPVIKVGNALRYINYDNPKETPLIENDTMYLPVKTFAQAIGYYYEENPEKNWVLLRTYDDKIEFVMREDRLYVQKNLGAYEEIENIIINRNGKYYVPVRYFSEIAGKTISAKDGYVVIDYRDLVRKAFEEPIFSQIKEEFSNYNLDGTQGRVYHVSQAANANDANDGSESAPFLTLNKAGEVAKAGDTVIVHNGTYRETFAPQNDGTGANPIIFKAAEGENPIISALEEVTAVPQSEGDMLVYDVGIDLGDGRNLVFRNGEAIREGRHPNVNNSNHRYPEELNLGPLWQTEGDIVTCGPNRDLGGNFAASNTSLDQEDGYWVGGTHVAFVGYGYNQQMTKIVASTQGKIELGSVKDGFRSAELYNANATGTDWGYITNHIHTVDMPGEWYMSDGRLWIIPFEGTDANTLKLEVKARQLAVDLKDRNYVQLNGINVLGGGIRMNDSKLCVLNGGSYRYISHYTMSVDQHYGFVSTGMPYSKDGEPMRGEMGIYLGGDSCAVVNSHIQWSAGAGIYVTGTYSFIENNLIEDIGYMGSFCSGIQETFADTDDITTKRGGTIILNNTLRRAGRSLYDVQNAQWNWNGHYGFTPYIGSSLAFNDISDASITSRDTGAVYMWVADIGSDRRKHQVHHNLNFDSWCFDGTNTGFYYDNAVQNAINYNNIIFSTRKDISFDTGPVFVQDRGHFPDFFSVVDRWNNTFLDYLEGGKKALEISDYPSSKYFTTGHNHTNEHDLTNYNLFNPENATMKRSGVSKGVDVIDNTAWFTGDEQWVHYENVQFDEDTNAIKVIYRSKHRNNPNTLDNTQIDAIQVIIGSNRSGGVKKYARLFAEAATENDYNIVTIPVFGLRGSHSVWVESVSATDTGIVGVIPVRDTYFEEDEDDYTVRVHAGTFTKIHKQSGQATYKKTMGDGRGESIGINNLWGGVSVVEYDNVRVGDTVDVLSVGAGSGGIYAGAKLNVHIDSPDTEPIGHIIVPERPGWNPEEPTEVYLDEPLKPGTYKMFITAENNNKVTDLWYFGFKNSKKNKVVISEITEEGKTDG